MSKYTFKIADGPKPEVASAKVYNIDVEDPKGQIKVKVYTPTDEAIQNGKMKREGGLPAHVNYHGGNPTLWSLVSRSSELRQYLGGWVIGSLLSDESWCRQACQGLGIIIVDVDYRLAPEYPFPAQVWDSWAALKWTFASASKLGIDTSRVSIGGLSAGGHIAAVLALLARDEPSMSPLRLQLLVVPCVDARWVPLEGSADPEVPYETYKTCEFAPCLPLQRTRWFMKLWLGEDMGKNKLRTSDSLNDEDADRIAEERTTKAKMWIASPILAESHANLAPASIHCAEFDVLRSEALIYNDVLNKAGTKGRVKVYQGVCHPWGHWDGELEKAKDYVRSTLADIKEAHSVDS